MRRPAMTTRHIAEAPDLPYRLGRHVNHDDRSRAFRFTPQPRTALVSKTWPRRVPIFDQGSLGSCTGNAAAGWLGTDDALRQGLLTTADGPVDEARAVAIYSAATRIDPFGGAYPPDDTGSDGLSVTKILKSLGLVDRYTHCFTLDEVLAALMETPVLIGINWYYGMFHPDAEGQVTISGGIAGGHELVVDAVNLEGETVGFANSWGSGWGRNGWGRMTFATLDVLLSQDGDATVPHALVGTPPLPPPAPHHRSWWRWFWDWLTP